MLLFIDCSNGVSGDRLVAALLDLSGARPGARGPLDKVVRPALKAAGIDPRLATVEAVRRDGEAALVFSVADAPGFASFDELVVSMYASAVGQPYADAVAAVADRLRAAERAVHGEDDVPRDELSGVATAVELVAAAALLHELAPARVVASPPPLGADEPGAAAGDAAAVVLQLLHGIPVAGAPGGAGETGADAPDADPAASDPNAAASDPDAPASDPDPAASDADAVAGDDGPAAPRGDGPTTPCGAALLAHYADEYGERPDGAVLRRACGAAARGRPGRRDLLCVTLVEPVEQGQAGHEGDAPAAWASPPDHVVLETNIDDMSPELLAHAAEALRDAGALDVWMTPALMKKGRPGTVLHVLAAAADRERLAGLVFAETTTFGLRVVPATRVYAEERRETVRIAGHDIGVRLAYVDGRLATVSPEYEDCRRAAVGLGRPARVVYEAAQARARSRFSGA